MCVVPCRVCRKWIGTTEAAALLRYFGVRALVVDFGTQSEGSRAAAGAAALAAVPAGAAAPAGTGGGGAVEVHPGVECDWCGACPITGAASTPWPL